MDKIKSVVMKNIISISIIMMLVVVGLSVAGILANNRSASAITTYSRELSQIARELQNETADAARHFQRLASLETVMTQQANRGASQANIFVISLVVFVILGLIIGILVVNGSLTKFVDQLNNLKKYIEEIRENKRGSLSNMADVNEIKEVVDQMYGALKGDLEQVNAAFKELDLNGHINRKELVNNKLIDTREFERVVTNINTKMSSLAKDLKDAAKITAEKNTGVWQNIKEATDKFKFNATESQKEVAEVTDVIKKMAEGNFNAKVMPKADSDLAQLKTELSTLQDNLGKFTKDVMDASGSMLNSPLRGQYSGELQRVKTSFDRAVENNKNMINSLRDDVERLRKSEREIKVQAAATPQRKERRSGASPLTVTPVLNLGHKDIDFTGRSLGKY